MRVPIHRADSMRDAALDVTTHTRESQACADVATVSEFTVLVSGLLGHGSRSDVGAGAIDRTAREGVAKQIFGCVSVGSAVECLS